MRKELLLKKDSNYGKILITLFFSVVFLGVITKIVINMDREKGEKSCTNAFEAQ